MSSKKQDMDNTEIAGEIIARLLIFTVQVVAVALASGMVGNGFPDLTFIESVGALALIRIAIDRG